MMLTLVVTTSPVLARHGSDDSNEFISSQSQEQESENEVEDFIKQRENEVENERKERAQERKTEIKQQIAERKASFKKDICEQKQANIQRALTNMNQNSPRILERFNTVYAKVVTYKTDNNITVERYDELITKVDAALAKAAADVEVAQNYDFTLDCDNQNVGEQLQAAREAGKTARESLKEYRSALKELVKAVKDGATIAEDSTEGTNNETTQ